jgi:hypothetical protein
LSNKWNSRGFAAKHVIAGPDLIWRGRDLRQFTTTSLPSYYAVRYAWGEGLETDLIVDGKEILDDCVYTPNGLKAMLQRQYGQWSMHPLLVEECLEDAGGQLRATQFSFYCFAEHVVLIEHVQNEQRSSRRTACTPEWNRF